MTAMADYAFTLSPSDGSITVAGGEQDHTIKDGRCSCRAFAYSRMNPPSCKHIGELSRRRDYFTIVTKPALDALRQEIHGFVEDAQADIVLMLEHPAAQNVMLKYRTTYERLQREKAHATS